MHETLISFKTAKLAKEKGFDKIVIASRKGKEMILHCPTQSLLQKWIREAHNIFLTIYCDCHGKYDYHMYDVNISKQCGVNLENQVDESGCFEIGQNIYKFNSYEEALEEGLYEILKIIK